MAVAESVYSVGNPTKQSSKFPNEMQHCSKNNKNYLQFLTESGGEETHLLFIFTFRHP